MKMPDGTELKFHDDLTKSAAYWMTPEYKQAKADLDGKAQEVFDVMADYLTDPSVKNIVEPGSIRKPFKMK